MTFYFASIAFLSFNVAFNLENKLILDYFNYKKTQSVVGFSCNIFQDLRCYDEENVKSLFVKAADHRMYDELHNWLIIGSNVTGIGDILDDYAFGMSTDFVLAIPSYYDEFDSYELYDVYNIWKERGGTLNITFMGLWQENNLSIVLEEVKFRRRANLHGMTVKAAFYYTTYKPDNVTFEDYLQDESSRTKDSLSKFGYVIVTLLSNLFNFTLHTVVAAKWKVGDHIGPMIAGLHKNDYDITGSPATMNIKRTYLVKYVHYTWPFRTCFVFRSPQPKNIKINEVLGPLDIDVWYTTAGLFILTLWIMALVFRHENNQNTFMNYSNSFLIIIGALCQQGTEIRMDHSSTRMAFLFIMLFSYLFYNYYSASVVSVRLNEPIYKLNDSLVQLAKTDLKLASEWMVYFELFIKRQDWETKTFYTTKWKHIPEANMFMEPEKAMRLVQEGGFAYHMHPDVGYPFINEWYTNREICELTEIHLTKPTYSSFAVTMNSSFEEMMRIGITKFTEVGIRKREVTRWKSQKPECSRNILSASSINMYEFGPHLLLLLLGIGLAIAIYILEIINNKFEILKWFSIDYHFNVRLN